MQNLTVSILFCLVAVISSLHFGNTVACRHMKNYPIETAKNCVASCRARGHITGECVMREKEGTSKKRPTCICSEEELTTTEESNTETTKSATVIPTIDGIPNTEGSAEETTTNKTKELITTPSEAKKTFDETQL